ncbi:MAG: Zn-ribbon containing protein [Candidatus Anstonellaceae archaeon]
MHICLKCKRIIRDIREIESGCTCGSKIFIYKNDGREKIQESGGIVDENKEDLTQLQLKKINESKISSTKNEELNSIVLSKDVKIVVFGEGEVENIRQVQKGVFEVNLFSLQNDPVVIKDENEVYYVRLPFEGNNNFKHQK